MAKEEYKCEACGMTFKSKEEAEKHMREHHSHSHEHHSHEHH
ncbi:hypothetical protein J5U22_01856 [Saccharolobus shibatae]|uniref:C2H2-type domain-containing protein n=1 Tax=Saccharolobus shibatae TaxID=2286 RepID=A0A8F5GZH2_9CREN|nr:hypothetical protein J5U22_01856 [Saccharolobus shibatae]